MFICGNCRKSTESGEKATRILIEKRDKVYQNEDEYGYRFTSHGWEIKKEIMVCKKCAKEME